MTIVYAAEYRSNAHLIAQLHNPLKYLQDDDLVLDTSFGSGAWWTEYRPPHLVTNAFPASLEAEYHYDIKNMPKEWRDRYSVVVWDPPYKLNGRPSGPDERYGVHVAATIEERHKLACEGIRASAKLVHPRGYGMVKCMNQVAWHNKHFQVLSFSNWAQVFCGLTLVDQFDNLRKPRAQQEFRVKMVNGKEKRVRVKQAHSRQNYSTLLVFQRLK